MAPAAQHRGRRLGAPTRQAREPVGRVAHERQQVGDRCGRHAQALLDPGGVELLALAPVELHHLAAHALAEVLVRRADHHPLDPVVRRGHHGGGRHAVVGLVGDLGPHGEPRHLHRHLHHRELGQQLAGHPRRRLVAGPQVVAERLDHVVGRHPHVRRPVRHELEQRAEHPDRRPLVEVAVVGGEVVAEQLVGAVDEVDVHAGTDRTVPAAPPGTGMGAASTPAPPGRAGRPTRSRRRRRA